MSADDHELHDTTTADPESGDGSATCGAEEIIEAIDRPRQADTMADGSWLPKLDLPGFGEEDDDCGEDYPHFCSDCGHSFSVGRTCAKSTCPRCGAAWVLKRAGTSREEGEDQPGYVGKIQATAKLMSARRGGESIKKHHVSFMPPMNDWFLEADDPLDRTFKVVQEIMDAMDMQGVIFYHPWSGDNADSHEDDQGEWKKRVFSERDFEGDVADELIPRGHFHVVGASPWIPGGKVTEKVYEETGWIIERHAKRDGSGISLDSMQDIASAVTYCLSHTGIDTRGDGNNYAAIRKKGAEYQEVDVRQRDMVAADDAVRTVAPRTLGIDSNRVKCFEEVAPEDQSDHDSATSLLADDDEEGEGSTSSADEQLDEPEMVPCDGHVHPIDAAPRYLDDPNWRADAPRADDLQTTWEDWQAEGDPPPG